jgi:HD-like signal output (HDOD) protein
LKLCNSAYFSKGKEITSIERAIVTLGIKELTNIVMVIAAKPILDKYVIGYDLGKGELWKQGLLVGILSEQIALLKNRKDIADVVFTGGIIHNVGKTVIAIFVQNTYNDILEEVRKNNITFTEAEKMLWDIVIRKSARRFLRSGISRQCCELLFDTMQTRKCSS